MDPLQELAKIAKTYNLWFHIDGAYGGLGSALPEFAQIFEGLGLADSIAVDPHKWMYATLVAACVLVKDARYLTDTFSYHPPYYNFEASALNYMDYGPQNSRGFQALKVWLSCQHLGTSGYRQLIREDIRLARYASELFATLDDFEVLSQHLSITTFRYHPQAQVKETENNPSDHMLNTWNQAILSQVERGGVYFLSNAILQDTFALRLCIVNFRTTKADIEELPSYLRALAQSVRPDQ